MCHHNVSNEQLYTQYLFGKQTISQLSERYHLSPRQIRRRLDKATFGSFTTLAPCHVIVQMDASYWSNDLGLLVIKDAHRGVVLWYKFLHKKETLADYIQGIKCLQLQGFVVDGVVCDGLKGGRQILEGIPFQLCQFHELKFVRQRLTKRPKTDAAKQLLSIANSMTHTDKESFEGQVAMWFARWDSYLKERTIGEDGKSHYTHKRLRTAAKSLQRNMDILWTFYDHPELHIPNTNNAMEAFFSKIKKLVDLHNGLTRERKMIFIEAFLIAYNAHKQTTK